MDNQSPTDILKLLSVGSGIAISILDAHGLGASGGASSQSQRDIASKVGPMHLLLDLDENIHTTIGSLRWRHALYCHFMLRQALDSCFDP